MSAVLQSKPKLPSLINLLLVIVLGVLASKLMWLILTPSIGLGVQTEEVGVISGTAKKAEDYGKLIANQHLFGEIKKKQVVKEVPKEATKKPIVIAPKLNLKLFGIVAYKENEGFALISSGGGPQKVYGEGEEIEKDVKVSKIYSDKVVIVNHGVKKELRLPVKSNKSTKRPVQLASPTRQPLSKKNPVINSSIQTPNNTDLQAFRQEVLVNPAKLMDIARPSPAVVNGQFVGFRVQPGTKRKLFRKLGFRPNDIIVEVNGILLDDPNKGAMVIGELSQASTLSVKVKRGDKEIFIEQAF